MPESFVDKVKKERTLVYYIRSKPAGEPSSWFFLQLDKNKVTLFDRAMNGTKNFDLKDYGTILRSGYGSGAPDALKQEMHELYGVEYDDQ